jgi:hypothetical protein
MARRYDASTSVSAERLRAVLKYEPDTGNLVWLVTTHGYGGLIPAGSIAGLASKGRRYVGIDGRRYAAHRLAWFYMTGEWPVEIDHKDCDPLNNRWSNLRLATRSQNNANIGARRHNTSGYKGVDWDKSRQQWRSQICVNGKRMMLGRFNDINAAAEAYRAAAEQHFGEFARI